MTDTIFITGVVIHARHGVMEHETEVGQRFVIDLELSAAQNEGKSEVISSPRVITANQKQATIMQGVEIPYQESASSGATTTQFKDAVLKLKVTPLITP